MYRQRYGSKERMKFIMKNIKKWLVFALALVLCLSMAACAAPANQVATLETSSTAEGETAEVKDPSGYESDIQGLCRYFEESGLVAGDKVQMSFDVIGASNGYKYMYRYNDSPVQIELYEFPAELSETAQKIVDSVRENGTFTILDNTVPARLSEDGRFLMIYTDAKSEKDDASKAHRAHVTECFDTFAQKSGK